MNKVKMYYCNSCGYEDFDIDVSYSRTVANGDLFYCPLCKEENFVEVGDDS